MADLSREDVLKLAQLARLSISDEEVEHYRGDLNSILGFVEQLQSEDVSGLEPTSQVTGLTNRARADEVINYQAGPDDLLKIAPTTDGRYIKVKRMIS